MFDELESWNKADEQRAVARSQLRAEAAQQSAEEVVMVLQHFLLAGSTMPILETRQPELEIRAGILTGQHFQPGLTPSDWTAWCSALAALPDTTVVDSFEVDFLFRPEDLLAAGYNLPPGLTEDVRITFDEDTQRVLRVVVKSGKHSQDVRFSTSSSYDLRLSRATEELLRGAGDELPPNWRVKREKVLQPRCRNR